MVRFLKKIWKSSKKPVLPPEDPTHQTLEIGAGRGKSSGEVARKRSHASDMTDSIVGPDIDHGGGSRVTNRDERIGDQLLLAPKEGGSLCDLGEREGGGSGIVQRPPGPEISAESAISGDQGGVGAHDTVQPRTSRGVFGLPVALKYSLY